MIITGIVGVTNDTHHFCVSEHMNGALFVLARTGSHLETNNTDVMTKARRAVPRTTETTTTASVEPANTPANV